ncbi:unnamed protein product [Acanthoscelides obtectus]|uniref:RNA methyltransferase n=1 Tax=Acanthoscelides obtectus TaxID=200917 RepID=A0A9P0L6T5_ACAOB|nr:unnamed protein product [Acanthoscelides obtectus]CAK1626486.1 Probable RNA methyltransferase CG1239 [Acanthoscelides obtectus]
MSSADVLKPAATTAAAGATSTKHSGGGGGGHKSALRAANAGSKRKNKHDRSGRKRSKSFSGCGLLISHKPVLPSKFLLGGNIKDPLNLGSLQDEEINRAMNAVTPKSSPVPTPPRKKGQIEVIIPRNIHDPLNLIDCDDDADYEQQLCSPVKKKRNKRMKKRRTISGTMETSACADSTAEAKTPEASTDSAKIPDVEQATCGEEQQEEKQEKPDTGTADQVQAQQPQQQQIQPKKERGKRKSDEYGPSTSGAGGATGTSTNPNPAKKFKNAMDKIVSPVVPQPGAWLKRANSTTKRPPHRATDNKKDETGQLQLPKFKEKDKRYQYGNYDRYYGYRNPGNDPDPRLRVLMHNQYLFQNKDILDIGCNIGHITLTIARDLRAKSALGIDIDPKLIQIAKKNVRHYVKKEAMSPSSSTSTAPSGSTAAGDVTASDHKTVKEVSATGTSTSTSDTSAQSGITRIGDASIKQPQIVKQSTEAITSNATSISTSTASNTSTTKIPSKGTKPTPKGGGTKGSAKGTQKSTTDGVGSGGWSYQRDRGCTANASATEHKGSKGFPDNVTFKVCNYVLEDDSLLANEQPQFDVILCLSMTKWIHLNWGDAGIKQAFRRMYAQLRPGGKLILEPQGWAGYKKRKKLTETIFKNYNTIEFFPEKFREYLLSPAVGFAKGEILGMPLHRSRGFRRPIQVFTKSTMFPSERIEATPLASGGYGSSDRLKTTGKYESQGHVECVEHVYTDLFDNRYCVSADDNADLNDQIAEELREELEKRRLKNADGSSCDMDEDFDNSMPATVDDKDKLEDRLAAEKKEDPEESAKSDVRTATPNEQSLESEVRTVASDAGGSLVKDNT